MSDLRAVARTSETLLLELKELRRSGPHIRIVHRFHKAGTECLAGEEVYAIYLVVRGREFLLPLSLALRLLVDYLARTRHVPQNATQIVAGMRKSQFHRRHACNSGAIAHRRFSRSGIKTYVMRIRKALDLACQETMLQFDAKTILSSRATVGNEILYQLRARVEFLHLN